MDVKEIMDLKAGCKLTDFDVIGDLLQPMDKESDFVTGDNNYVWFFLIGKYFKPKVIAETGTRFGYSMKAFVSGAGHNPEEFSIWSYDCECDGIRTLDIFKDYFINNLHIKNLHINTSNIRTLSSLSITRPVDLYMVDADHSAAGCYHECSLGFESLKKGGIMIVDDVNFSEPRTGVERFCSERGLTFEYLPSLRGIYIIQKPLV